MYYPCTNVNQRVINNKLTRKVTLLVKRVAQMEEIGVMVGRLTH